MKKKDDREEIMRVLEEFGEFEAQKKNSGSDEDENSPVDNKSEKEEKKEKKHLIKNPFYREIVSYIALITLAIIVGFTINTFILSNNVVPTSSMAPTIPVGSRLFGFRLSYAFSEPERGDIVIFRYPVDETQYFVKRIIGLPGDKVEIKDGAVYINDTELDESDYLEVETKGTFGPYYVPEDSYFMMGDNRNNSSDSRYWNDKAIEAGLEVDESHDYTFVSADKIVSKAIIQYYPTIKLLC